ncbi:hypothetical protein Scep_007296 [Stephania cephalantha]|uniref:Uncharacterized protein n=1 Tax=Stephania cephalantha TaxID=152367 RepID=A0AAP0PN38_9MAGN
MFNQASLQNTFFGATKSMSDSSWYMDNGASSLVTSDQSQMTNCAPLHRDASGAENPHWGREFPATGIGIRNLNGDGGKDGDKISYPRGYGYGDGKNIFTEIPVRNSHR